MNGRRAKAIRRKIYGTEYSPRAREYFYPVGPNGTVLADRRRELYQAAKKASQ